MTLLRSLVIIPLLALSAFAQTYGLLPVPRAQFFDSSGRPLAGGQLFSYAAGTSTPQPTYIDASGSAANPNPVILDAGGSANVWLNATLTYKFVLKSAAGVTQWTVDGVTANGSGGGGSGTFLPLAGGTMTGAILMGGPGLIDIGSPSAGVRNLYIDTGLYLGGVLALNNTRDATLRNVTITGTCTGCSSAGSFLPLAGGTMTGNILVNPTDTVSLGSNTAELNKVWVKDVNISGTCSGPGCGGGGSFLPLSGGTMSGNIQALVGGTLAVGSKPSPFGSGFFSFNVSSKKVEFYDQSATDLTGIFFNMVANVNLFSKQISIRDDSNNPIFTIATVSGGITAHVATIDSDFSPLTANTRDLGSFQHWRNLLMDGALIQAGVTRLDSLGNGTVNNLTILGTCSGCPGTGGGTFLPLGGGTMAGNIAANAINTLSIGSKTTPFSSGYFQSNASTRKLELYDPTATDLNGIFFSLTSNVNTFSKQFTLRDDGNNNIFSISTVSGGVTAHVGVIDADFSPATANARDLGSFQHWRNILIDGTLIQGGVTRLDASGNLTVNSCTGCGGSTFTGGIVTGGIFPNADNTLNLGGTSAAWANVTTHILNGETVKVATPGLTFSSTWSFTSPTNNQFRLFDNSGIAVLAINAASFNNYQWGIRGTIYPTDTAPPDGDLGLNSNPFNNLWLSNSFKMNGTTVVDSSRNAFVQNLTVSGTCSGCGGGGGAVSSVTGSGLIAASPTTGAVVVSCPTCVGNNGINTFTGTNTFTSTVTGTTFTSTGTSSLNTDFSNSSLTFFVQGDGSITGSQIHVANGVFGSNITASSLLTLQGASVVAPNNNFGVSVSGSSCTIRAISGGIITSATCP